MPRQLLNFLFCFAGVCALSRAEDQTELKHQATYRLWPGQAPGALGDADADTPVVQAFLPEAGKATAGSVVVCPGGGYRVLASHETAVIGEWLAKNGITAFVLRYRLCPKYSHPIPMTDAQRAIRFVRHHAKNWKLDPDKIGILGFSAGGHLTSTCATHFDDGNAKAEDPIDRAGCKPNAQILVYPLISMDDAYGHAGCRTIFLGKDPTPEAKKFTSAEQNVTEQTPPAFVFHSVLDQTVIVHHADKYVEALKAKKVPVEYIRGEHGPHGIGLNDIWTVPCIKWLRDMKW